MRACKSHKLIPKEQKYLELLYKYACNLNSPDAQFLLGWVYGIGDGVNKDAEKSFYWCQKSAGQGHAKGTTELGHKFFYGSGVMIDYKKAMKLFKRAGELGDSKAFLNLGDMYFGGFGVEVDKDKAAQMYSRAAALKSKPLKPLKLK